VACERWSWSAMDTAAACAELRAGTNNLSSFLIGSRGDRYCT